MSALGFRALAEDDLALLFDWLARPHVKRWYAPAPGSFAEIAAKYRPRTLGDNEVKAFIVQSGGADVGYIQAYAIEAFADYERLTGCEKGAVGIDLFIADAWRTGHGLGAQVIRRFVDDVVFGNYGAVTCVAGPAEGNKASIRAFQKAGFRTWKTVVNEKGERECLMRRDRDTVGLRMETIDLAHAATSAAFRRDMYATAFGTTEGLEDEMGPEDSRYLAQLREVA
jgi:RimJ/RimL family protein N-acetyltransferase